MKVLIEESDDHATCMDTIRTKYGADCLVVHSFRSEDTYRVLIALESTEENAQLRSLEPLKNVVTQRSGVLLSETQIASESEMSQSDGDGTYPKALERAININDSIFPSEISSGLLELAARVKALEEIDTTPRVLAPESQEFREMVFSDVLAETSGEIVANGKEQLEPWISSNANMLEETRSEPAQKVASSLARTVSLQDGSQHSNSLNKKTSDVKGEATSSAESFATLLAAHVEDSKRSELETDKEDFKIFANR